MIYHHRMTPFATSTFHGIPVTAAGALCPLASSRIKCRSTALPGSKCRARRNVLWGVRFPSAAILKVRIGCSGLILQNKMLKPVEFALHPPGHHRVLGRCYVWFPTFYILITNGVLKSGRSILYSFFTIPAAQADQQNMAL